MSSVSYHRLNFNNNRMYSVHSRPVIYTIGVISYATGWPQNVKPLSVKNRTSSNRIKITSA